MPRILRSPGSKSFRLENVSVPNADGARCGRRRNPERTQSEVRLGSKAAVRTGGDDFCSAPDYRPAAALRQRKRWASNRHHDPFGQRLLHP